MSTKAHVRTGYALVNDAGESNPEAHKFFCGAPMNKHLWYFDSPSHIILALRNGTGIDPCRRCLRAMLNILTDELGLDTVKRLQDE